ncbi:general odorant-binding protein 99a-like [Anopheles cruzii]|uniref:general odorant-binding protein 99a-like n=1 Tax=Anopheles cruzii TaxID=68878 RepID=UPI0022EC5809|nr:general odorant-binding protein 99a-like [Anopheles cruzii]
MGSVTVVIVGASLLMLASAHPQHFYERGPQTLFQGHHENQVETHSKCSNKLHPVSVGDANPTYRPASYSEFLEVLLDCFNTLRIPLQRFPAYLAGLFPEDAETKCLLRCVAIKLGVYSDETGADLERHCLQFGLGECCDAFAQRHALCLQQNSVPCPDRCTAAYKQELCFQEPMAKYMDFHFNDFVAQMHKVKCSHNMPMLHP